MLNYGLITTIISALKSSGVANEDDGPVCYETCNIGYGETVGRARRVNRSNPPLKEVLRVEGFRGGWSTLGLV